MAKFIWDLFIYVFLIFILSHMQIYFFFFLFRKSECATSFDMWLAIGTARQIWIYNKMQMYKTVIYSQFVLGLQ